MEPFSSFAINIAAGIALNIWKKKMPDIDTEIKEAFESALKKWSNNESISRNNCRRLKKILDEYIANQELHLVHESDHEIILFVNIFRKELPRYGAAFDYLKEIKDEYRYKAVLNRLDDALDILHDLRDAKLQRKTNKELTARIPLLYKEKIIERADILSDLFVSLRKNQHVVLVNGMGGLGKTTIAQRYITEYSPKYKHLVWIGITSEDFITDFVNTEGLNENMGIALEGRTLKENFIALISALKNLIHEESEQSLIVIDNVEKNITQFIDYLPNPPHWHILATSRHRIEEFNIKELAFLNEEQAVALFRLFYKRSDLSIKDIKQIVKELDYHTLTIEILAKTAQNNRLDVQKTISTLAENYSVEVTVRHAQNDKIDKITSYLASIFDIGNLGEEELWLLKQFFYLPPIFHTYGIINTILAPTKGDKPYNLPRVLTKLTDKGWLLFNKELDGYKLHRIIHDVLDYSKSYLFEEDIPILKSVNSLLSLDQTRDNPIDKFQWIPFGKTLLERVIAQDTPLIAELQTNLALVLKFLGDYSEAKELLIKAKISNEKHFGVEHPTIADSYSNLAIVLQDLGDYNGAKDLLEKTKISNEKNFGLEHPTTAAGYSNLALVLMDLGEYSRAKNLLEKAKASYEKHFGEQHPTTAVGYSNLALVLMDLGEYSGARELLEKAKIITEKNLGQEHPTTAVRYSTLAVALQNLGKYSEAKELLEKAKTSNEKNFGEEHPTTADSYSNLAMVFQDLGDYSRAKNLLEKAKTSNENNFGEEHPTTANSYSKLAIVLQDLGDYSGAKNLLEKVKISYEKNFGEEHPKTAECYSNLALVLKDLGDYSRAKKLLEKAIIILLQQLGWEHPSTQIVKNNWIRLLIKISNHTPNRSHD